MTNQQSKPTRFNPHVTVAAVVEHDGNFLFVEERIAGEIVYTQPAGHLDDGESLITAVIREVAEETGLNFTPTALIGIYRWVHPEMNSTWIRFTFCGDIQGSREPNPQDADILGARWIPETEIRSGKLKLRSPQVIAGIDDYNEGIRIDLGILREMSPTTHAQESDQIRKT